MSKLKIEVKGRCMGILYASEEDYKKGIGKKVVDVENLILYDGQEIFADLSGGTASQTKLQCIGIGDDNTTPDKSQTDLQGTELGYGATSNSRIDTGKERFEKTFAAGQATGTWREAVLADTDAAKGARKCACRTSFNDIVKGAGEVLTWIWDISFAPCV